MSHLHRFIASSLLLTSLFLIACGGAESDAPPGDPPLREVIAFGAVGPQGGRVEVTDPGSEFFGVGLVVPAGALDDFFNITIARVEGRLDSLETVETFSFEPFDLPLRSPARVNIGYRESLAEQTKTVFAETSFVVFEASEEPRLLEPVGRALERNTVGALTDRLGEFFVQHPDLYLGLHVESGLIDPERRQRFADRDGRRIPLASGAGRAFVGSGSIEAFFKSDAEQNLLVLHDHLESPFDLVDALDWLPENGQGGLYFAPKTNVIAFQYPSARPLSESANRLYEILWDRATRGFSTDIVAHGTGGLIARYLLERSHLDREVPFAGAPAPRAEQWVERAVLVGTPNLGVEPEQLPLLEVFDRSSDSDRARLGGVLDQLALEDGFTADLNQFFNAPTTRYFGIAGSVFDTRGDLVVPVLRVLQAPPDLQFPTNGVTLFGGLEVEHRNLHELAATNGVLEQIRRFLER
ncbi:MAG: hypothetical protein RL885_03725 [Planctomycetota bacterium]